MTSSPVMGSQIPNIGNFMNQTANTSKTDMADFKSFMNQSKNNLTDTNSITNKKSDIAVDKTVDKHVDEKVVAKSEKTENVTNTKDVTEVTDEKVDAVKDAVEEVSKEIKEELGVSDEEIAEALETLGLTMISLLDSTKLPAIIAELTDAKDTLSIVMDENLYANLTNLTEKVETVVNELSEEIQIPKEELEDAIKNLPKAGNAFSESLEVNEEVSSEDTVITDVKPKTFDEKITINVKDENKVSKNDENVASNEAKEVKETTKLTISSKESGKFENKGESNNSQMTFAQMVLTKAEEAIGEMKATETVYTSVDVEDVMNQITEFIKVDISEKTTEVNLKLHPESLGTVNVRVSANNEGVLTAQFTAQNESVKAIIESQAVVLREALEQKGVTIEAVEVLVQSHEFERNFNDQNRNNDESNGSGRRAPRRINLIDDAEEVNDDDKLVREMMLENGNTIDYSA